MPPAQRAADPVAALAEWDAEFRTDIGAFLDDASIDAAVDHGRPLELPAAFRPRGYVCDIDRDPPRRSHPAVLGTFRNYPQRGSFARVSILEDKQQTQLQERPRLR